MGIWPLAQSRRHFPEPQIQISPELDLFADGYAGLRAWAFEGTECTS
jgi:hypothetical protein